MADRLPAHAEVLRTRDLTGWNVMDVQGNKVGTVRDLLIDRGGRVRFLDVDYGLFRKHVLIPSDVLDWGADALVLERWTQDDVKALPPYDTDVPLTTEVLEEMERAYPRFYGRGEARMAAPGEARVVPLGEARDFKLPKGAPDPRGWNVFGADGERVGVASGLLVDPAAMKVRYLDVDLADDLFALTEDRHVLIPLEYVELRERGNDAWVERLSAREVARLPAYIGGAVDPIMEERIQSVFTPRGAGSSLGDEDGIRIEHSE